MKLTSKLIADKVIEFTGFDIRESGRSRGLNIARLIYIKLCIEVGDIHQDKMCHEINKNRTMYYNYFKNVYNEHIFNKGIQHDFKELEYILLGKELDYIIQDKYDNLEQKHKELKKNYSNSLRLNRVIRTELIKQQKENLELKLSLK